MSSVVERTMEFGDAEGGFSVGLDEVRRTIEVRAWGFWAADVAVKFPGAVLTETRRGLGSATRLVIDGAGLKPQRDEGQEAFAEILSALKGIGITRALIATDSPLTRLQLLRIVKERAATGVLVLLGTLATIRSTHDI
jgi:hypothetical protein